jgi:antitoxin ParD1/3/4
MSGTGQGAFLQLQMSGLNDRLAEEGRGRRLRNGKVCHTLSAKETAMGTMNISLPDPMKSWVEDQAKSGRYANSSDYVRDLIRRDRMRHEAIAEIQAAVDVGLASGPASPLDREAFKARMRAGHAAR